MSSKILVAYASKHGATEEIAGEIGQVFSQGNTVVDVLPVCKVRDITPYRGIVLGTSIRAGRPRKEALSFTREFHPELAAKPFALFSVGIQMRDDTPENREKARAVLAPITVLTGEPSAIGLFAGRIDYKRIGFPLSFFFKREPSGAMREGDWRDWDMIRTWAADVAALWKE